MKKLNLAIIGQGRSGKNIHGLHLNSEHNKHFNVKYVVERDDIRRERALTTYPGCKVFASHEELYAVKDELDLVVNVSFSNEHYEVTKDLLEHGFNVLVDKPFARNRFECNDLIRIAKEKGVLLAVFQQTFFAPFFFNPSSTATVQSLSCCRLMWGQPTKHSLGAASAFFHMTG